MKNNATKIQGNHKEEKSEQEVSGWFQEIMNACIGIGIGLIFPFIHKLWKSTIQLFNRSPKTTTSPEESVEPKATPNTAEEQTYNQAEEESDNNQAEDEGNLEPSTPIQLPQLSFSEAFAQARIKFGPGSYFEWNGKVYGTYYREEWNSMSKEERDNFANNSPSPTNYDLNDSAGSDTVESFEVDDDFDGGDANVDF